MQILVTGTTGGIGGAVKAAACAHGHAVIELNRADFGEWGPAAGRDGQPYRCYPAAGRDPSRGRQADAAVGRQPYRMPFSMPGQMLDALVFCTGMCPVRPVALTADELLAETVRVNCGLFLSVMRTVVAEKLYNPAGFRAVAVSSVSATEGWPGGAAYCASKGALSAMCRAMDAELKAKKISVRAIEPRYVKTKMFDACAGRMGVPASEARAPEDLAEEILAEIEAGREEALSFSRDRNVASPLGCDDKGEARESGRSE